MLYSTVFLTLLATMVSAAPVGPTYTVNPDGSGTSAYSAPPFSYAGTESGATGGTTIATCYGPACFTGVSNKSGGTSGAIGTAEAGSAGSQGGTGGGVVETVHAGPFSKTFTQ